MGDIQSPPSPIRVALVDDHDYVHQTVEILLGSVTDIDLVAEGINGHDAIRLCQSVRPDIILMDVIMPDMGGIEATQIIHERFPEIRVLVLSSYQDNENVYAMLRSGASGYIVKGSLAQDLLSTIRATYAGNTVLSADIASRLLNPSQPPPDITLTDRELEVLGLMAAGINNPQIAYHLNISQSTVKFHISNILDRLGVETRAEALVSAARHNLI
jgi:DNA-binding NarL/FixJ family response regulator